MSIRYALKTANIVHLVHPANEHYKSNVGEVIYPFVEQFVGEMLAPKITGMMIEMDIPSIKGYLSSYGEFVSTVRTALGVLKEPNEESDGCLEIKSIPELALEHWDNIMKEYR